MTSYELTISGRFRTTAVITHSSHIVIGWIDDVFNSHAPLAGANRRVSVGLHVECSPPYDSIALIQLCVGNSCLVYQLLHRNERNPPCLLRLNDFLTDDRFYFIGANVELTIFRLRLWNCFRVRSAVDLGDAAARRLQREDLQSAGLDQLAREVLGIEIIRLDGAQRMALFNRALPLELVAHVCLDAIISYEIGRTLLI
ncbi:hypothetical protein ACMD2_17332 [Ananas comosus]|uniref:Uncharacterized protein n=1 Tax=Ananas comosus TaxID=4615 RepID=A0A199W8V3_ANACO|nr:hypothetical protein ACMD2_17332 [Ananas comosus]